MVEGIKNGSRKHSNQREDEMFTAWYPETVAGRSSFRNR